MIEKQNQADHYFTVLPKSEAKLGLIHATLRGRNYEFVTSSGVFSKKQVDLGTRLLVEEMTLPDEGFVLDLGCGYGPIGIAAAACNSQLKVIMTDVNTRAINLAKTNAKKNHVKNVEFRCGSLYKPVEDLTFNCILSNPPVSAGMKTVKNIITMAPKFMSQKATLQMVVRSKIGTKILPQVFKEKFGKYRILSRKSGYRVLVTEK